jgi:hypothetical protein
MTGDNFKRTFTKKIRKPFIYFFLFIPLITCIDPFNPQLKGNASVLTVDALLTNEHRSYAFKLSWTSENQNTKPLMASGVTVTIRDKKGSGTTLTETEPGVYKTDSLQFLGETGNSYILNLKTPDGNEYESDTCTMYPVQPIDNIYFARDNEFINNGSEIQDGIRIFIDSENKGDCKYVRWIYNEWWKFSVPQPKIYEYIDQNNIFQIEHIKQVCYASNSSNEINIKSTAFASTNKIERQPVLFVASDKSNRLLMQYYVEIKQLSLSKTEFEFWDRLKKNNAGGGDIFGNQPFQVPGNIHNKSNPSALVLGYFQVSAVEPESIYITPDELASFNLPAYEYTCERFESGLGDFPASAKMTFDKIYAYYTNATFAFIEPVYDLRGNLQRLAFTKNNCALCTLNGSLTKPDFWIDMKSPSTKK